MNAKKAGRIAAQVAGIVCAAAFVAIVYTASRGHRVSTVWLFIVTLVGFWSDWRLHGRRKK